MSVHKVMSTQLYVHNHYKYSAGVSTNEEDITHIQKELYSRHEAAKRVVRKRSHNQEELKSSEATMKVATYKGVKIKVMESQ